MKIKSSLLVAASMLLATSAEAGLVTTYDKAVFLANAGSTVMESFENIAPTPGATLLPGLNAGDLDDHFDVSGVSSAFQIWDTPSYATDGDQALFWLARNATPPPDATEKSFTLSNFNGIGSAITALGLYIIDWASAEAVGTLTFSTDTGESFVVAVSPPSRPDWNTFFFGAISDVPFTSATFTTNTDDGYHLIDEVYYSRAVPVPAPLALLLTGGLWLAAARRRQPR